MCGICGLLQQTPGGLPTLVTTLALVNHRGHEAVGIAATNGAALECFRDVGYVRDACTEDRETFRAFGQWAIDEGARGYVGHTRYSTVGPSDVSLAQPFVMAHPTFGPFALAHNGQIVGHHELRRELEGRGHRFHTVSDSEVLAALIAESPAATLPDAAAEILRRVPAAYSFIVLDREYLVAARDPLGVRPLWWRATPERVLVASETGALTDGDGGPLFELPPGALLVARRTTDRFVVSVRPVVEPRPAMCIFEILYFARPDHRFGETVASALRRALGQRLAASCPASADLVCSVPDSSTSAALGYAEASGIPFEPHAFVKNWYSVPGRSFILPGQRLRQAAATRKYATNALLVRGKRVVVVDDTIVRGNTIPKLIARLRAAEASEIHVRIAAAPIRHPCFYGIDIPTAAELIASGKSEAEIGLAIGADSLQYLPYDEMVATADTAQRGWCAACFTGRYPTPIPDEERSPRV